MNLFFPRQVSFFVLLSLVLIPSGCVSVVGSYTRSISRSQLQGFENVYKRKTGAKAFAIGPHDAWAMVDGHRSIKSAMQGALIACNRRNLFLTKGCYIYHSEGRHEAIARYRTIKEKRQKSSSQTGRKKRQAKFMEANRRRTARVQKKKRANSRPNTFQPKIKSKETSRGRNSEWRSSGSGFYLKGTTHIMTNLHVIGTAKSVRVSFPSGSSYSGQIVARDEKNDVALLTLHGMKAKISGFDVSSGVIIEPGMKVHAIGYPLGADISIVSGDISSATGPNRRVTKFTMTAPINEGSSGGPVIDERGNLIGMSEGGLIRRDVENVRIASKISAIKNVLNRALRFRRFSIQVSPKRKRLTSREIFRRFSPYVVRIEVR